MPLQRSDCRGVRKWPWVGEKNRGGGRDFAEKGNRACDGVSVHGAVAIAEFEFITFSLRDQ